MHNFNNANTEDIMNGLAFFKGQNIYWISLLSFKVDNLTR